MHVELSPEKRDLLAQLVYCAIREIGPEIRHTSSRSYKDDLKQRRRELQGLCDLLKVAGSDEFGPLADSSSPDELIGTP